MVEEIVLASELRQNNPQMMDAIVECFERQGMKPVVTEVEHAQFKQLIGESQAIVRTGECTPYANIILKSGVVFLALPKYQASQRFRPRGPVSKCTVAQQLGRT